MSREKIAIESLQVRSHNLWAGQWLLLSSGDFSAGRYNTMTVAWGSLGTMWGKPFAQVVVRPSRYTYEFMEQYDTFTLCCFAETHKKALSLLGSRSGRDGDKIRASGLTPSAPVTVSAPVFEEAELVIECRKIYWEDFDPARFLVPEIEQSYPNHTDYHRAYFGEILHVEGERGIYAAE
jgi:flavin reductase (DIM6/NTAB) family NADH-FMN oxidoreductase RutF